MTLRYADQDTIAEDKEIHYLQSQNGNMFTSHYFELNADDDPSEFEPLREDVPSEVHWCSEALGMMLSSSPLDWDSYAAQLR